jgi:hypothetical protein
VTGKRTLEQQSSLAAISFQDVDLRRASHKRDIAIALNAQAWVGDKLRLLDTLAGQIRAGRFESAIQYQNAIQSRRDLKRRLLA